MANIVTITGFDEVFRNLQKIETGVRENVQNQVMQDLGEKILELSQNQVPLDEGTLLRSGIVAKIAGKWMVGYNTEYAARLHFHPEYHFQNGRKAYYLTDPISQNRSQLEQFALQRISAHMLTYG